MKSALLQGLIPICIGILVTLIFKYIEAVQKNRQVVDLNGDPYLVRYFLFKSDWLESKGINIGRLYLHHIIRSDHDRSLHDHPWNFRTFLLTGQYREWADVRQVKHKEMGKIWKIPSHLNEPWPSVYADFKAPHTLRRGAGWRHRLEVTKPMWTLVFVSNKKRPWGFWQHLGTAAEKFCNWKKYDTQLGICEDDA